MRTEDIRELWGSPERETPNHVCGFSHMFQPRMRKPSQYEKPKPKQRENEMKK